MPTGSGTSLLITDKSATGTTAVTAVVWLFAGTGSVGSSVTRAELVMAPGVVVMVTSVTVTASPADIMPMAQMNVPEALEQLPWLAVALMNCEPGQLLQRFRH